MKTKSMIGVCLLIAGSAPAFAGDWYVDGENGSNANGGTGPLDAWQTITHALASVPPAADGETQTIHVAAGTYDTALGESFPLDVERGCVLSGPPERSATIDGGGAAVTLVRLGAGSHPGKFGDSAQVEHFRLVSADCGVDIGETNPSEVMTLRDLEVTGMSTAIRFIGRADVLLRLEGLDVHRNGQALIASVSNVSQAGLLAEDCVFRQNAGGLLHSVCCSSGFQATYRRCRIEGNVGHAMQGFAGLFAGLLVTVEDSLVADNSGHGWTGDGSFDGSRVDAELTRCTIAGNGGAGIQGILSTHVTLDGCILWGNADDISHPSVNIRFSDIEDGDGAGKHGNFSADPLFVERQSGDWRLRWGSPCVEAGNPATPGTLDLARNARPIDGDLSTLEAPDVGAFEFAPLFLASTGELGSSLVLELWGPRGNATTVFFTRTGLVAPQPTAFGQLDLDRGLMDVFDQVLVSAGPPMSIRRRLPHDPALAGLVLSFQALTSSAAAPNGKAYTNGVQLTLRP